MKSKHQWIVFCLLFSVLSANAQDTIYIRTKEIIHAKIIEIGIDEIKYKIPEVPDGPTVVIPKDQIWKIVFASGVTQILQPEMFNPENYSSQHKNALKIDFLSPMYQHITFVYELSLKPGQSAEASLSIIGVGFNTNNGENAHGAFVRLGYKFIKSPDYYLRGMKYTHILKGSYVRPDILIGTYTGNYRYDNFSFSFGYQPEKVRITYGSFQMTFGKQWVFDDLFLVDYFFGLGYTFSNINTNYSGGVQRYGVEQISSESPFSISGGLRIGILF
ncbi:MAG: hypothetical protein NT126_03815 [Bacteroidetes bacterium]|nr:hypothetical protein [Bacteroidota bacterium]